MLLHLKGLKVKAKSSDNLVIFFHIPKTAGTSFCGILETLYKDKFLRGLGKFNHLIATYPECRAFAAHLDLSNVNYSQFTAPITHLTVLRHPVERVLSQYHYLKTTPSHPLYSIVNSLPIDEIYAAGLGIPAGLQDTQVQLLSSLVKSNIVQDRHLMYAKENLDLLFTNFGLAERFDDFVEECKADFGWQITSVPRLNVSNRPLTETEPKEVIDLIESYNHLDISFYEYAKELYEKRLVDYILISPEVIEPTVEETKEIAPSKSGYWKRFVGWIKNIFGGKK